jgi:hypothetical protein
MVILGTDSLKWSSPGETRFVIRPSFRWPVSLSSSNNLNALFFFFVFVYIFKEQWRLPGSFYSFSKRSISYERLRNPGLSYSGGMLRCKGRSLRKYEQVKQRSRANDWLMNKLISEHINYREFTQYFINF